MFHDMVLSKISIKCLFTKYNKNRHHFSFEVETNMALELALFVISSFLLMFKGATHHHQGCKHDAYCRIDNDTVSGEIFFSQKVN